MPEYAEKLNYFTKTVLTEAAQENERLLAALDTRLSAALRAAEDDLLRETFQLVTREAAAIRAEAGRRVSLHMMDCKRRLALRREELARAVFAEVAGQIAAFTKTDEYPARLRALFSEAAAKIGRADGLVLSLRAADLPLFESIVSGARGVTSAPGEFTMGGLMLDCPAAGLRIDASFDSVLRGLDGHFAELFGLSLSVDPN